MAYWAQRRGFGKSVHGGQSYGTEPAPTGPLSGSLPHEYPFSMSAGWSTLFGRHVLTKHQPVEFRKVTDGLSKTIMVGEVLPYTSTHLCVFCFNMTVSSTHIPFNLSPNLPGNFDPRETQADADGGNYGQRRRAIEACTRAAPIS